MKKIIGLTAILALTISIYAEGQQRVQRQRQAAPVAIRGVAATPQVPVFKVVPGEPKRQQRETDLSMVNRAAQQIKPTPKPQTLNILKSGTTQPPNPQGAGNVQNAPDPKITQLTMSARDPHKGSLGYLEFNEVRHYDAEDDFVLWFNPMQSMGYMKVHMKVEQGSKYLVDWSVSCDQEREFHYASTGGSQTTKLQPGTHHLFAILEPQSSGMTSLMMWADVEWAFHSVHITKTE